ncbi:hypothetical protein AX17_001675 [Amanita inopinata Kibby_2008]|nr:hypothetical protein AX17_001675 [Amanita inopinata Kibby_2008]
MADAEWAFSHEFSSYFQAERSDLMTRIHTVTPSDQALYSVMHELSQKLAKLSRSLADANERLPSYDQRQYGLQMKAMEKMIEELRSSSKPRTKFAFKRPPPTRPDVPQPPSERPPVADETMTDAAPSQETPNSSIPTNHSLLSSHSYRYISLADLPSSFQPSSDLTISGLDHCIMNLTSLANSSENTSLQLSAVHVENLKDSVLILPVINGSILLHDLTRCVVVAGCHQFRMHSSMNVHVYLSITSNPIIEHCSGIRFTAYPGILATRHEALKGSQHLSVQDFSHIRPTPSPNWSILGDDSIITSWPLTEIQDGKQIQDTLSTLLPSTD